MNLLLAPGWHAVIANSLRQPSAQEYHMEYKSSVPLSALLFIVSGEHSTFNKQLIVFCICP